MNAKQAGFGRIKKPKLKPQFVTFPTNENIETLDINRIKTIIVEAKKKPYTPAIKKANKK